MNSHFAVLASLALAIFLSPETLVLGLIFAGDRRAPRLAAFAFAVGGVVGIAFAAGIGLWIAHLAGVGDTAGTHHGWPGFIVRVVIAAALLAIGLRRAFSAVRKRPISDTSEPERHPGRLRAVVGQRFPALMRRLDPDADLPVRRRVERAGLAGFAVCGLNPKVFPIAIAAGHQILQISDGPQRTLGIVMFAVISAIPAVSPAIIDLVNPGTVVRVKAGYERIMKVHGRWITALLLLGAGSFVAFEAFHDLPGR